MENHQRKEVDLSEFVTLDNATIRSRYPAILHLYKYRISNDKRNRDAYCIGCSKIIVKSKVARLIGHSKKCSNSDQTLVKQLETSHKSLEAHKSGGIKVEKKSRPEVRRMQKTYDDQVVDLIAVNSLPLNLIKSKELRCIYTCVDSSYQLPTRERLNALLATKASTELTKSLNKLKEADNYSVTIEMTGFSFLMAIIVTTCNGHSTLLDLVDVSNDPESSTNLAAKALDVIRNSKIPDQKFNSIMSDDTRYFMLARDIIFEDFNSGRMIEFRSFAHVINQMSGSVTKSLLLKDTFNSLLKLVDVVSRNKHIVLKLKERGQTKVFDSLPTTKSSPSTCINWALQVRNSLHKMPRTDRYNPSIWESILTNENFWEDLSKCKPYFDKITTTIQEASYGKLSEAFHSYLELGKFIMRENNIDTTLKDLFTEAYVTHFNQLDYNLLLAAYVLNPNMRMAYLTNKAIREAKEYITTLLAKMGHKDDVIKVAMNEYREYADSLAKNYKQIDDVYSWWSKSETVILKIVGMRLSACAASACNTHRVNTALEAVLMQEGLMVSSSMSDMLAIQIAQPKKKDSSLEAPLLSPDVINFCVELSEDAAMYYSGSAYTEFTNLIDYTAKQSDSI